MTWEAIEGSICALGESPRWDDRRRCLFWCDIEGRRLLRLASDGSITAWPVHAEPGCLALTEGGWLLVAVRDGLYRFDPESGAWAMLVPAPYDPAQQRFNDGACDRQGRFWVGTIHEPRDRPAATLYRLDADPDGAWHLTAGAGGVVTANGLAFPADGRSALWADTRGHRILRFDLDPADGRIHGRGDWATFAATPAPPSPLYGGRPDGAALDADGGYWVAMYEGGCIVRLDSLGRRTDTIELPVSCPTMVAFGGDGLQTLYVTTARAGRPADELAVQPLAGALWRMPAPVAGLADARVTVPGG